MWNHQERKKLIQLAPENIRANPAQPRQEFDKEALDFERVQFMKNIEDYSEGQKKKILLAASLLTPAHLYIWDEPMNYIDVFSRMQLEKLLSDYRPTMLFTEHDIRFREKIATKTIEL